MHVYSIEHVVQKRMETGAQNNIINVYNIYIYIVATTIIIIM
jgi:hypothetical protein